MNNKFIEQIKCWFTFLFIICSTFSAWGAYAQTAKVTLQMDNVRMEQVMNEIEKQTSYFFIVNKGVDINRTISINVADKPLGIALQAMVAGTKTEYKIYQQNIYLSVSSDKINVLLVDFVLGFRSCKTFIFPYPRTRKPQTTVPQRAAVSCATPEGHPLSGHRWS